MQRIGVTGQNGFLGYHLIQKLRLNEKYKIIKFQKNYFNNTKKLDDFVKNCDVLIHLAALIRSDDKSKLYNKNLLLTKKIVDSLLRTKSNLHLIMSSTNKENLDQYYGKSKKESENFL